MEPAKDEEPVEAEPAKDEKLLEPAKDEEPVEAELAKDEEPVEPAKDAVIFAHDELIVEPNPVNVAQIHV